jgi:hypothetical protein
MIANKRISFLLEKNKKLNLTKIIKPLQKIFFYVNVFYEKCFKYNIYRSIFW